MDREWGCDGGLRDNAIGLGGQREPAEMAVLLFCWLSHRELREKLKPELLELIRQQRLLHLCEGTLFRKISSRRRQGGCQSPAPGWGAWQGGSGLFPCSLPQGKSQLICGSRMPNSLDSWYGLNPWAGRNGEC